MTEIPVSDHADLVAVVTQAHRADPAGNLFVIPVDAGNTILGEIRVRLPDPPDPAYTVRAAAMAGYELTERAWDAATQCAIVAFAPAHVADPVLDLLVRTIRGVNQLSVFDVLRADRGRCWSYLCSDECHGRDGEGMLVDPLSDTAILIATELGRRL